MLTGRLSGGSLVTSRPRSRICPPVGSSKPADHPEGRGLAAARRARAARRTRQPRPRARRRRRPGRRGSASPGRAAGSRGTSRPAGTSSVAEASRGCRFVLASVPGDATCDVRATKVPVWHDVRATGAKHGDSIVRGHPWEIFRLVSFQEQRRLRTLVVSAVALAGLFDGVPDGVRQPGLGTSRVARSRSRTAPSRPAQRHDLDELLVHGARVRHVRDGARLGPAAASTTPGPTCRPRVPTTSPASRTAPRRRSRSAPGRTGTELGSAR